MTTDKWYLSYRIYITVIGIIATALSVFFGIDLQDSTQKEIADFCMQLAPVIMAALAIISKIREQSKARKEKENGKTEN